MKYLSLLLLVLISCKGSSNTSGDNFIRAFAFFGNTSNETLSLSISGSLSQDSTSLSNTVIATSASSLSTSTSVQNRNTGSNSIRCIDHDLATDSVRCLLLIDTGNISGATDGCFRVYYSSSRNSKLQSIASFSSISAGTVIQYLVQGSIPSDTTAFSLYSCNGGETFLASEAFIDYTDSNAVLTDSSGNYTVSLESGKTHTLSIRRPSGDVGDVSVDLTAVTTESGMNEIKEDPSKLAITTPTTVSNTITINGPVTGSTSTTSTTSTSGTTVDSNSTTTATIDSTTLTTEVNKDTSLTLTNPITTTTTTPSTPTTYSIGGTASNLPGTIVLQNNGGDTLSISSSGSFTFPIAITSGGAYAVTVLTQPTTPSAACTISNGSGVATSNVTGISISCICGTETYPWGTFTDMCDGTVKLEVVANTWGLVSYSATTLYYMRCTHGQTYRSVENDCQGAGSGGDNWNANNAKVKYCSVADNSCNGGAHPGSLDGNGTSEAYTTCNNLNSSPLGGFAGHTNWRVPTIDELRLLVKCNNPVNITENDKNCANSTLGLGGITAPTISNLFTETPSGYYWSSVSGSNSDAWYVLFSQGLVDNNGGKADSNYLRCVSGP
ncbi:MAG: DUF1566 domain-containing protein [Spirochaetota bacterium]